MMFWPRPVELGGVGGRDRGPLILKSQGEGGERVNKMNHRINCSSESLQKMPTSLEMLFSACCTNPNWFFVRRLTMQQQDHPWKRSPLHLQLSSVREEGTDGFQRYCVIRWEYFPSLERVLAEAYLLSTNASNVVSSRCQLHTIFVKRSATISGQRGLGCSACSACTVGQRQKKSRNLDVHRVTTLSKGNR